MSQASKPSDANDPQSPGHVTVSIRSPHPIGAKNAGRREEADIKRLGAGLDGSRIRHADAMRLAQCQLAFGEMAWITSAHPVLEPRDAR